MRHSSRGRIIVGAARVWAPGQPFDATHKCASLSPGVDKRGRQDCDLHKAVLTEIECNERPASVFLCKTS